MGRSKDPNLTKTIHVRISEDTDKGLEQLARELRSSKADIIRLGLNMFIRRGGVAYANEDD